MTKQILGLTAIALLAGGCASYSKVKERSASAVTTTAGQKALSKSLLRLSGQPLEKLGVLLDAANTARVKLAANASDAAAQSDYNYSVGRIVDLIEEAKLTPWETPVVCGAGTPGEWSFGFRRFSPRPELDPSNFEFLSADRYEFKGKLVGERTTKQGLGAPLIVLGKNMDFTQIDQFAQGERIYYGLTALIQFDGRRCELVMMDPLADESVSLDGRVYPLAADFQAPLALALAQLDPKKTELAGLFKADRADAPRLARLQPYDSNKIPVICIHGLGNSPSTWAPMINHLRTDAAIREAYQFWFFKYPSGLPYPLVTATLRTQLDQMRQRYQDHKDIVIIGHSMGGMISRLLITDSGMAIWDAAYDKPPSEMPFSEDTRAVMSDALIFKARSDLARVIFCSASHRGSDHATGFFGKLGAKLVGNPIGESEINDEAIANARPNASGKKRERLPNSVDILDPDSRFLQVVNELPVDSGIPYHSIIGDRGKGGNLNRTKPQSSDGVVPYWSSHIEGAQSELIIPSGHWSNLHPQGMAEVKRILIGHLR